MPVMRGFGMPPARFCSCLGREGQLWRAETCWMGLGVGMSLGLLL